MSVWEFAREDAGVTGHAPSAYGSTPLEGRPTARTKTRRVSVVVIIPKSSEIEKDDVTGNLSGSDVTGGPILSGALVSMRYPPSLMRIIPYRERGTVLKNSFLRRAEPTSSRRCQRNCSRVALEQDRCRAIPGGRHTYRRIPQGNIAARQVSFDECGCVPSGEPRRLEPPDF
jgi:hypothetical protein